MTSLVHMNHGRWLVDCPHPECAWSYLATTNDGRPRYQTICAGDHTGRGCGTRIDITWPDAALEIERALCARTAPINRNWRWPETVDGLLAENLQLLVGWNIERLAEAGIGAV